MTAATCAPSACEPAPLRLCRYASTPPVVDRPVMGGGLKATMTPSFTAALAASARLASEKESCPGPLRSPQSLSVRNIEPALGRMEPESRS